ncbi:DUF1963 domain-containing protein, partial [Novosphingobium sp. 1949]
PAPAFPEPEAEPAPAPAPFEARTLRLVRKARTMGRDWFEDSSWFGGLPRLGAAPWPSDEHGTPLPFLAQIDLADVAAIAPTASLPGTGSLAFFLGDGAVVPVAAGHHDFTDPPQDLPPAFNEGGALFPQRTTRLTRWLFPFWPVALSDAATGHGLAERDHPFYAVGVGEPVETLWWHSVHHFADRLRDALDGADGAEGPINTHRARLRDMREALSRIENDPDSDPYERDDAREDIEALTEELARIEEQRRSLPEMLAALDSFLEGRAPWTQLTSDELEIVRDLLPETHERYGELAGDAVPASLAEVATISLRAMISGPDEALAAIPAPLLERINSEYRLPAEAEHRLFQRAHDSDELVLLELAWDDMVEWWWPEEGRCQWRITPADAAAGNWHAARVVFITD